MHRLLVALALGPMSIAVVLGLSACQKKRAQPSEAERPVPAQAAPKRAQTSAQPALQVPAPPVQGSPERPVLYGHVDKQVNPKPVQEPLPPPAPAKLPEHHPLLGPKEQPDNSAYIREHYE